MPLLQISLENSSIFSLTVFPLTAHSKSYNFIFKSRVLLHKNIQLLQEFVALFLPRTHNFVCMPQFFDCFSNKGVYSSDGFRMMLKNHLIYINYFLNTVFFVARTFSDIIQLLLSL